MKKGVKTVNICVLHFTIGSQIPPNNTRHIMDTLISRARWIVEPASIEL